MANEDQGGGALTVVNNALVQQVWNEDQAKLVAGVLAKDANLTAGEMVLFAQVCHRTGLDPIRKQIYAVRYKNGGPITFQTAIDGFRVIAKRSGKLRGILAPQWCGEDGEWHDVWISNDPPSAARVMVRHADYDDPVVGIALYNEYVATRWDKDMGRHVPNSQWTQRPAHMLAKCAEALAIRRAFPDDVGGLYSEDEMEQAGNPEPTEYIDHATGEYVEQAEIFGADEVTLETLYNECRRLLSTYGLQPGVLRQVIPDWQGSNVREGLEHWARQNPNIQLVVTLDELLAGLVQTVEQASYDEEAQQEATGAAAEADAAAEAEQTGRFI